LADENRGVLEKDFEVATIEIKEKEIGLAVRNVSGVYLASD
jgi:hypothetical protein